MTLIRVRHVTTYRYGCEVAFGAHRMMLAPRDEPDQRTVSVALRIDPTPSSLATEADRFGNLVTEAGFDRDAARLSVASTIVVRATPQALPARAALRGIALSDAEYADAAPFLAPPNEGGDELGQFVSRYRDRTPCGGDAPFAILSAITEECPLLFRYQPRHAPGVQRAIETLRRGSGTCRDFASLVMACARTLGLPARFVSGYVVTDEVGCAVPVRGGGSTHAWAQVLLPGHGWLDLDATNAIVGSRDLVRVSVTPCAETAIPLRGTFFGNAADCLGMTVSVRTTAEPALSQPPREEALPC